MGKPIAINLDDAAAAYLENQVSAGRFASTSEAVSEAVKLLQAHEIALQELRAEIQKGEDSGYSEIADADSFFAGLIGETRA